MSTDRLNLGLPDSGSMQVVESERIASNRTSYLQRNEARLFALEIVRDPTYRENLKKAALARKLHPSIEALVMHYAWGKPTERVELGRAGDFSDDLSNLSDADLKTHALTVASAVVALEYENSTPEERASLESQADEARALAHDKREAQYTNGHQSARTKALSIVPPSTDGDSSAQPDSPKDNQDTG